jgi:phosphoglucosamine mutase
MEMLTEHKGILGGENSGHIICLDRTTTGDGIVAALQVLEQMHETGKSLHELKSGMQKYPQILLNIKVAQKVNLAEIPAIQKSVAAAEQVLGKNGRILLRASGTEPLIRVMVEGSDEKTVTALAQQLAEDVKNAIIA